MSSNYKLEIISPEKLLFSGCVESATFPGAKGRFTVLYNHAPLISVLEKGTIRYIYEGAEQTLLISGGFVEVRNNSVTACVEVV